MKKVITLLTCLVVCGLSYGKGIDVNTAQATAYSFLKGKAQINSATDMQLVYTATATINGTSVNDFYVFNSGSKGFVIVSGDDRVMPVLAYSGTSSFKAVNMPTNLSGWLKNYTDQISYVIGQNIPATQQTVDRWSALAQGKNLQAAKTTNAGVSPLLTTTWDQEPFYNAYCPYDNGYGQRAVTGCVATATAQVMKYWNWPVTGAGAHSYIDPTYGYQFANYGTTTYQWGNMPNAIINPNDAIATLMYQVGVSVNMTYGTDQTDGSGAYVLSEESPVTNCTEFALKTYFHYKQTLHGVQRDPNADETDWINLIENELNAGRPVLYEGFGPIGGHNWVGDGYDINDNIHFNWGWSGQSDGYYTVDNLAPPALGVGAGSGNFNTNQAILVGVEPDSSATATAGNIKLNSYISTTASPTGFGQGFSFTTTILNSDTATFTGNFAAQVFNQADSLIGTVQTITNDTIASGDSTGALVFATTGMYNLMPGIYSVRIYYQATAGNWLPVADNANYINYSTMAIANDTDLVLADDMQVTQNSIVSDTVGQGPITVNAMLSNFGGSDFEGTINLSLYNISDGSLAFTIQNLTNRYLSTSSAYYPSTFTFANSDLNLAPGVYLMMLEYQATGNAGYAVVSSNYSPNPVFLTVDTAHVDTTVTTAIPQIGKSNIINIYPNPASDVVYIDVHNLNVPITAIRIMDMQGREMKTINATNASVITVPVNTLAAGLYFVELQTGSGIITKKISVVR